LNSIIARFPTKPLPAIVSQADQSANFATEPVRTPYGTPIKSISHGFSIVVIWVGLPRTADRGRGFRDGGGAGDARRSSAGSGGGM
jgi:hypothetical protein